MKSGIVYVRNKLGLHARAAAQLVRIASGFESEIKLVKDEETANAKGIMGLMMLAATRGTQLELQAEGPDEDSAFDAIHKLFDSRFGEEE